MRYQPMNRQPVSHSSQGGSVLGLGRHMEKAQGRPGGSVGNKLVGTSTVISAGGNG